MMNGILAFVVAGGACSLVCYMLMNRAAQARRPRRARVGADSSSIGPSDSSGGNWGLFSWSNGDSSSSHDSSSASDFGGDSGGGGGDGGGGGGD